MPTIAAGEKAPFFARYGYAYYGQARYGDFQMTPFILVNGVDRTADVEFDDDSIEHIMRDRDGRDELSFVLKTGATPPTNRDSVQLAIGAADRLRFNGLVKDCVRENATGGAATSRCGIVAIDRIEIFDGVSITKRWAGTNWHTIVSDVVAAVNAELGTSFTAGSVKTGSPDADEYIAVAKPAFQLLQEVAGLASGGGVPWFVRLDWNDDVHFYDTETAADPVRSITEDGTGAINSGHRDVVPVEGGGIRIRNKVRVHGKGSQTTGTVAAGVTSIAVDDVKPFADLLTALGNAEAIAGEAVAGLAIAGSATTGYTVMGGDVVTFTGTSVASGPGNLTGVPASGDGSVTYSHDQGEYIRIRVQADDAVSRVRYNEIIHEIDAGDDPAALCLARAVADVTLHANPPQGGEFDVYGEIHALPGSEVVVAAPNALGQNATFVVSELVRTWVGAGDVVDTHAVYGNHVRRLQEFWKRVRLSP